MLTIDDIYRVYTGRVIVHGYYTDKRYFIGSIDTIPHYLMTERIVHITTAHSTLTIYIER